MSDSHSTSLAISNSMYGNAETLLPRYSLADENPCAHVLPAAVVPVAIESFSA